MDPHDLDRPDMPVYGLHNGVVLANEDPEQLGRVRVRLVGFIEEGTGWALPLGTVGGGERERGFFAVPEVGSEVCVLFHQGNVDEPYYLCSNWGRPRDGQSDVPAAARDRSVSETPKVRVFETERFELVFDDNLPGEFRVKHKTSSAQIKIDGLTGSVSIEALGNLSMSATGNVSIDGLVVTINGIPAGSGRL